jgi:hypothetical protein
MPVGRLSLFSLSRRLSPLCTPNPLQPCEGTPKPRPKSPPPSCFSTARGELQQFPAARRPDPARRQRRRMSFWPLPARAWRRCSRQAAASRSIRLSRLGSRHSWTGYSRVRKCHRSGRRGADGRNVRIDTRWPAGDADRYRAYAAELVGLALPRTAHQHADAPHPLALLRPRRERPRRRRASEQRDELPPPS